ncbi:hypothetical protein PCANC_05591 [Puccinia coronata f. sp. avenae]|uniref:Uncharacterized protein n=1 Tax=Puccinia coronata f. sp. avenae TaxID=200324 RepID=A0A2N5VJW2_9BASI|nr:hypothetical protein PCASD_19872 [Puccinia coronata f. sp. avenae]PLW50272.1 hypothetical protein PCASD_01705 [Puccinia coronata f. sp. avenae]PLW54517.1 hypothetical protein PCANC_05591 [Puccinia coronata f. sp. avenae]
MSQYVKVVWPLVLPRESLPQISAQTRVSEKQNVHTPTQPRQQRVGPTNQTKSRFLTNTGKQLPQTLTAHSQNSPATPIDPNHQTSTHKPQKEDVEPDQTDQQSSRFPSNRENSRGPQ